MSRELLEQRLGSLEDVEFKGLSWHENHLRIELCGNSYSEVHCQWARGLMVDLNWGTSGYKTAGPLLSNGGSIEENLEGEIKLTIYFGSHGHLSVECSEIQLIV